MNMDLLKQEILKELKKNPEAVDTCEDYAFRFLLKKDIQFKRKDFEELGEFIRPFVLHAYDLYDLIEQENPL